MKKGDRDLDDLKQELELDEHKVPIEELYQRLQTNPDTVSSGNITFFIFFLNITFCVTLEDAHTSFPL